MTKLLKVIAAMLMVLPLAMADDSETARLREEVMLLRQQVQKLTERLESQETKTTQVEKEQRRIENLALQMTQAEATSFDMFAQRRKSLGWTLTGNVDVVGYYLDMDTGLDLDGDGKNDAAFNQDRSDVLVDQVRLNLSLPITSRVMGKVALQFEDWQNGADLASGSAGGDTESGGNLEVDEAWIRLNAGGGVYSIIGKQYFPFGNVDQYGHFILDSQARALYETRDTGITLGWELQHGFDLAAFVFNGPAEERTSDSATDTTNQFVDWGTALRLASEEEGGTYILGLGYLSNLYQADNSRGNPTLIPAGGRAGTFSDPLPAMDIYLEIMVEKFWLGYELVYALEDGAQADIGGGGNRRPMAWTLEAAYTVGIGSREYTFAGKYERNRDQEMWTPITSVWGIGASTEIYHNTRLSLNYEYWQLEDIYVRNTQSDTNRDGRAHVLLTELSIQF